MGCGACGIVSSIFTRIAPVRKLAVHSRFNMSCSRSANFSASAPDCSLGTKLNDTKHSSLSGLALAVAGAIGCRFGLGGHRSFGFVLKRRNIGCRSRGFGMAADGRGGSTLIGLSSNSFTNS